MVKINFVGDAPVYVGAAYPRDNGAGHVYGVNILPGVTEIDHNAWAAVQEHPEGKALVGAGRLKVSETAAPAAQETAPEETVGDEGAPEEGMQETAPVVAPMAPPAVTPKGKK